MSRFLDGMAAGCRVVTAMAPGSSSGALRAGSKGRWLHGLPRALVLLGLGGLLALAVAAPVAAQEILIDEGENWKYFKGTEAPPSDWNALAFDDSGWTEGATPIGYGGDLTFKTTLDDMQQAGANAGYLSVYFRKKFQVNLTELKLLRLRMRYDDGYIAYLNGVEIVRKAMPTGAVTFDTPATDHETNAAFEDVAVPCAGIADLVDGENVLAIEGHNVNLTSSDFGITVVLDSLADICFTDLKATERADKISVTVTWKRPAGVSYEDLSLYRNGDLIEPGPAAIASNYIDRSPAPGENTYELVATFCETECRAETKVTLTPVGAQFRRGDADDNAQINLTDSVFILLYLFRGGTEPTCLDSGDTNDDGIVNLTDSVYLLQALFQGGPAPPAPYPDCGTDVTDDANATCAYVNCS